VGAVAGADAAGGRGAVPREGCSLGEERRTWRRRGRTPCNARVREGDAPAGAVANTRWVGGEADSRWRAAGFSLAGGGVGCQGTVRRGFAHRRLWLVRLMALPVAVLPGSRRLPPPHARLFQQPLPIPVVVAQPGNALGASRPVVLVWILDVGPHRFAVSRVNEDVRARGAVGPGPRIDAHPAPRAQEVVGRFPTRFSNTPAGDTKQNKKIGEDGRARGAPGPPPLPGQCARCRARGGGPGAGCLESRRRPGGGLGAGAWPARAVDSSRCAVRCAPAVVRAVPRYPPRLPTLARARGMRGTRGAPAP